MTIRISSVDPVRLLTSICAELQRDTSEAAPSEAPGDPRLLTAATIPEGWLQQAMQQGALVLDIHPAFFESKNRQTTDDAASGLMNG